MPKIPFVPWTDSQSFRGWKKIVNVKEFLVPPHTDYSKFYYFIMIKNGTTALNSMANSRALGLITTVERSSQTPTSFDSINQIWSHGIQNICICLQIAMTYVDLFYWLNWDNYKDQPQTMNKRTWKFGELD